MAADALANLFYTSSIKCSSPAPQYTMNAANNNQFTGTGIGYDTAGDMTSDIAYTYTYDAENRVITASGMTGGPYCYTYDGNGLRVRKAHASGGSCTGTVTVDMLYWRSLSGNTIAETDGGGSTTNSSYNEYIFFGGRRIAESNPSSGSVYYYFVDHLGNTRAVTTATGTGCYEADYLPYGTENTPAGFTNSCSIPIHYKFTGYERDAETAYGNSSGNDYAFARYYNSRLGRFMSGDPMGGSSGDPQSLNHYSYVENDPINSTDPSGLCPRWGSVIETISARQAAGFVGRIGYDPVNGTYQTCRMTSIPPLGFDGGSDGDIFEVITTYYYYGVPGDMNYEGMTTTVIDLGSSGNGPTYAGPWDPQTPTIGPDPVWSHSKQAQCAGTGTKEGVKDALGVPIIDAVGKAFADASLKPLGALFSGGTAVDVAGRGADYIAGNRGAVIAIRGAARSSGFRISGNAIAREAGLFGKIAGWVGTALSLKTGYDAYKACMNN